MKRTIRLTESELIKIVKKVIKENDQKVMLRKMTKKSVLGDEGGIYRNWTVQKLLDNAPKKVFQIYTNYEKITFVIGYLQFGSVCPGTNRGYCEGSVVGYA